MTTQTKMPQALFPDLPRESPVIDKNNSFTNTWTLAFSNLFQTLQTNLKNEGFLLPSLNASQITTIQNIYTPIIGGPLPLNIPDISGQTIFDSTIRVPKVFIITYDGATPPNITAASWKTYTLT
jgi:hypothetical protein